MIVDDGNGNLFQLQCFYLDDEFGLEVPAVIRIESSLEMSSIPVKANHTRMDFFFCWKGMFAVSKLLFSPEKFQHLCFHLLFIPFRHSHPPEPACSFCTSHHSDMHFGGHNPAPHVGMAI